MNDYMSFLGEFGRPADRVKDGSSITDSSRKKCLSLRGTKYDLHKHAKHEKIIILPDSPNLISFLKNILLKK